MDNSRIITAPDLDLDNRFKVLLVDVEWTDIEQLSQSIKKLGDDVTLFLYGSNDTDDIWCINAQKHSYSTIVNLRHAGSKELLKGYLLSQNNVWGLGSHTISDLHFRTSYDIFSWFANQYKNYNEMKGKIDG